jgi:predicted ester cyclase
MSEANKELARRVWNEIYGRGNFDVIDEHFTSDFFWLPPPGVPADAEGFKQMASMYRAAFGDIVFDFVDQVAEGDKVANRVVITGTHQGEFAGVAATGNKIEIDGASFMDVRGGKIASELGLADVMTLMQQVGAMPS